MKKITLELDGTWVLAHREDDKLPLEKFVGQMNAQFGDKLKVEALSFTACELLLEDSEASCEDIDRLIHALLKQNSDMDSAVAELSVCEAQAPKPAADKDEPKEETRRSSRSAPRQEPPAEETPNQSAGESVLQRISTLIGAQAFQALAEEIQLIAPQVLRHNTKEAFLRQSYLFSINEGGGLSTCLELFAALLKKTGLCSLEDNRAVAEAALLPPDTGSGKDPFSPVWACLPEYSLHKKSKLLCIDISEWMTKLRDARFRSFLMELESRGKAHVLVFRVPFVEPDVLEDISDALQDILCVRTLSFPPLSGEELVACGKRKLSDFHYSADESVWPVFEQRLIEEKSDGRFYGMNTVNKVVREMVYRKQLSAARAGVDSTSITAEDIKGLSKSSDLQNAQISLADMVGMEQIQQRVEEIIAQIEATRQNSALKKPCLHMRFVGNPGTGKTTVARLIGQILKQRGVLRNGYFFEHSGRDFCGEYIGSTAPKTAGICRDAYGSVLFIDEAYSLYRGDRSSRDYGREALDTLIAEMENHRGDMVVIMAGYPDEMETLMEGNAGLESRMPYLIEFPNYTREQLLQIYMNQIKDGITCADGFEDAVRNYFQSIDDAVLSAKTFSNARFVRNLFERTCAKAVMRRPLTKKGEPLELTKEDFWLASSESSFQRMISRRERGRIGF